MMDALRKEFKAAGTMQDNSIQAIASTTGNMDRSGDVIAPGAFKSSVLRDFVENGALLLGHDWDDLPCGYIESAKVSGDQLISSAIFHSDPESQRARIIAGERMGAGKSVSVSVGFMPDYDSVAYYDSGAGLLKAAEEMGMDLNQFDVKGIKAYKYGCRMIRSVVELFEWSIVLVSMNPRAKAIAVKDLSGGSAHGLTLENELEISLAGMQRVLDVAGLRQGEGRKLSESRLHIVRQINAISGDVLASHAQPEAKDDDAAKAEMQRREELLQRVNATLNQL